MNHRTPVRRARRGFTLIEAAMATVVIGVGVVAMVEAQQAFIRSNLWSSHAATGTYLANEIRELTRGLPRHDPVVGLYLTGEGSSTELVGWGRNPGETTVQDFNDIDDFSDMSFTYIGTPGPGNGDLPGPINAFGEVIPQLTPEGEVVNGESGAPLPMQGWAQNVYVEKVNPFNFAEVVPRSATEPPAGDFPGRAVDEYPLRVTVEATFRAPFESEPTVMARVTWIVP